LEHIENLILGAGISGISASYHLGHDKCLIVEKNSFPFGVLRSENKNSYTWDQGPHVSFTKHEYVKELFAANVKGAFEEHFVSPVNYYKGLWLDHPIQSNLYQLPKDIRNRCVESFLIERNKHQDAEPQLDDYKKWCSYSLGEEITNEFIARYTRKYWTVQPEELTTDWIGPRVHVPDVKDFLEGAEKKRSQASHYISKIRYPSEGGYQSFVEPLANNANILLNHRVISIDLQNKLVECSNGSRFKYKKLISTIPLPIFVSLVVNIDKAASEAAQKLRCSELLLVNVEVPHKVSRKEHWLYVYDQDMLTSRVTLMDNLAPSNAPEGRSAVQVEVYSSIDKPLEYDTATTGRIVVDELFRIGLINEDVNVNRIKFHTRSLKYANIIFDHNRRAALDCIFTCLEAYGLRRKEGDLDALTDWNKLVEYRRGDLCLLGRFGEWKYYWSDDCVMAGKALTGT
jgi:protoporphyrinogen oxidase